MRVVQLRSLLRMLRQRLTCALKWATERAGLCAGLIITATAAVSMTLCLAEEPPLRLEAVGALSSKAFESWLRGRELSAPAYAREEERAATRFWVEFPPMCLVRLAPNTEDTLWLLYLPSEDHMKLTEIKMASSSVQIGRTWVVEEDITLSGAGSGLVLHHQVLADVGVREAGGWVVWYLHPWTDKLVRCEPTGEGTRVALTDFDVPWKPEPTAATRFGSLATLRYDAERQAVHVLRSVAGAGTDLCTFRIRTEDWQVEQVLEKPLLHPRLVLASGARPRLFGVGSAATYQVVEVRASGVRELPMRAPFGEFAAATDGRGRVHLAVAGVLSGLKHIYEEDGSWHKKELKRAIGESEIQHWLRNTTREDTLPSTCVSACTDGKEHLHATWFNYAEGQVEYANAWSDTLATVPIWQTRSVGSTSIACAADGLIIAFGDAETKKVYVAKFSGEAGEPDRSEYASDGA